MTGVQTCALPISVNGVLQPQPVHASTNAATGLVTFAPGHIPPPGSLVTAGFLFDVPVRFDIDAIEVDLSAFEAGEIPRIPVVEIIA